MLLRNCIAQVVSRQQPYTAFATWDTRSAFRFERHCCRAARCAKRTRRQRYQASVIQSSIDANVALLQRRQLLAALATIAVAEPQSSSSNPDLSIGNVSRQDAVSQYMGPGPFKIVRLPKLEHTCHKLFPECLGTQCILRLDIFCPKGGSSFGAYPPFPLAIFSGGFLVGSSSYVSYAERLASWGYVCVLYDKAESAVDNLDDELSVKFIQEIMDWCGSHPVLSRVSDTSKVYLCGHSRGGKLSVLTAAVDSRVAALCLLDPVDNTIWAPLGPGYPSGVEALKTLGRKQEGKQIVPLALLGAELAGDCAPKAANFRLFYDACTAPTWMVSIPDAGHFQFLDKQTSMQRAVCTQGRVPDYSVRQVSQAVMVTWAKLMMPSASMGQLTSEAQGKSEVAEQTHADSTVEPSASLKARKASLSTTIQSLTDSFVQLDSVVKNV